MSIDEQLLREALRVQPTEVEEYEGDLSVESMGDEGFDWIVRELRGGELSVSETVRGLRLLARLTRQFCAERKGELLDVAMALAQSSRAQPEVRSAAAHIAVMNAQIAKGLRDPQKSYGRASDVVQTQVSQAVRRALEVGLTREVDGFVREYLSGDAQK
jgi:hypothetical protein